MHRSTGTAAAQHGASARRCARCRGCTVPAIFRIAPSALPLYTPFPVAGVVAMPPVPDQSNPMHGVTLERILTELVAHYGWNAMGQKIEIRCFTSDPSVGSSLKFLRRTPWARQKVEAMYRDLLRVRARQPKD